MAATRRVLSLMLDDTETMPLDWAEAIARAQNPFAVAMSRYARAPIAFVREVLHVEPDRWQLEALRALARGHTRIAIRSSHGVGKTALAAWSAIWFSNTRGPFKLAMTAPTAPQLFDALYPELLKWLHALPAAWRDLWTVTADHVTLKANADCFITARTSRPETPEALAGLHSDHVMLIVDEASGVPEQVFEAASGSMSSAGAITLLIGNPTRSSGFFWNTFMHERDRWWTMKVSHTDSPRVTKGFAEEIAQRYGIDSNAYRVRCLGEFPVADADTVIPAELVDSAMVRDVVLDQSAAEIWGVDVARFGTDASVLIKRRGNVVPEMPRRWRQFDTMQLAGAIKAEYDAQVFKPALICIDVIGIGAGVVDRLHEMNLPILGINVAEVPSTTGRYARLRDELWVRCREWLETRAVRLPRDDQLRDDLAAPRYSFLSDGRLKVEDKNSMRARGLASPDAADALNMTFAEQGLGIASGMTSGLHDSQALRMDLGPGAEI
jgi:phage terminase large subunit